MTDAHIDPVIDLSIETLARACKGNVRNLPTFMVHDDHLWPAYKLIQQDSKNRLHLRRSTFNRSVASQIPVKDGLWLGPGVQEFSIDLQPHHLQGSDDMIADLKSRSARIVAKIDKAGLNPQDEDYGEINTGPARDTIEHDEDAVRAATGDDLRGVKAATLDFGNTEPG